MPFEITIPSKYNLNDLAVFFENGMGNLRLNVINAADKISTAMKDDLNATTTTWNHAVIFDAKRNANGRRSRSFIGSSGVIENPITVTGAYDIWRKVDEGATVSGRGVSGWTPKTYPSIFSSGQGSGYWLSSVKQLNQIEPRSWSLLILNRYDSLYQRELDRAVDITLARMERNS